MNEVQLQGVRSFGLQVQAIKIDGIMTDERQLHEFLMIDEGSCHEILRESYGHGEVGILTSVLIKNDPDAPGALATQGMWLVKYADHHIEVMIDEKFRYLRGL